MRTHPLIALAVIGAAITTMTVFGQSAPSMPATPARKSHRADAAPDAPRTAASAAVPAWLVAPVPIAPPATSAR